MSAGGLTATASGSRPDAVSSRAARLTRPLATIGVLGVATGALRLRDPHVHGSWGYCPLALLGIACPACGSLRAVNDLTHGEVVAAVSSNALLVAALPVAVVALAAWVVLAWRGAPWPRPAPATLQTATRVAVAVVVLFTVARNLPFGAWLAP